MSAYVYATQTWIFFLWIRKDCMALTLFYGPSLNWGNVVALFFKKIKKVHFKFKNNICNEI